MLVQGDDIMANTNTDNINIENGNLNGIIINDTFSVRMSDGSDQSVNATWNVNLPVAKAVDLLWGDIKVKMRAATLKKMSIADLTAMNGGVHEVSEYLTAKSETATAQVKALKSQLDEARNTAVKAFMEKAMAQALEELPEDSTHDQRGSLCQQIFDREYAGIINIMYPV